MRTAICDMRKTFVRHCERSEAILKKTQIASGFALAMTFMCCFFARSILKFFMRVDAHYDTILAIFQYRYAYKFALRSNLYVPAIPLYY